MSKPSMLRKGLIVTLAAMAGSLATAAGDEGTSKAPGSGPNPFSDCGIGAALFSETKWAAVTSNVIWDIGTTGVTSATASPETCNGKRVETAQFIIDNYDNLVEETARGEGQHLTAMLEVRGCDMAAHTAIISAVRSEMAAVVSQPGYADHNLIDKASDLYNSVAITIDQRFPSSCSA